MDLDPSHFQAGQLPPMAAAYLARAGSRLLDIHIVDAHDIFGDLVVADKHSFIGFLPAIFPRTWGITVAMRDRGSSVDLFQSTIFAFLDHCVPGVLTQVSIQVIKGLQLFHTIPRNPAEQLEPMIEVLGPPVTVLRLHNYYPKWASKIYHGLTELCLKGPRGSISESALITILRSSPKLRVLAIGIHIAYSTPIHTPVTSVLLADLEALTVYDPARQVGNNCQPLLMRIIQPGPNPLTLSLGILRLQSILAYNLSLHDNEGLMRFFGSSNITRLVVNQLSDYTDLANLLALMPKVRVLALHMPAMTRAVQNESVLPLASTVDSLYVTNPVYTFATSPLEQIIRRHGVSKVTLWSNLSAGVGLNELSTQATVISREEPNPILEWL
ncbi:F-box-like domain protein, putative, partial [Rhizoctonia solani AG-3 Rhs1AP]